MTSTMNLFSSYCVQVEHSDMDTIDLIMEDEGYDTYCTMKLFSLYCTF